MFRTSLLAATALVAGITIGGVAFHASGVRAQAASSSNTYEQLNLFGEVFERIRDNYVEPADDEKLIECRSRPRASSAALASKSRWKRA
jgi:carboxyl-terminal processing protease